MTQGQSRLLWGLVAAHIVVALVLLPMGMYFGFFSVIIIIPGLVWLVMIGCRLFQLHPKLDNVFRNTHLLVLGSAVLLIVYGFFALEAARRSAEGGAAS